MEVVPEVTTDITHLPIYKQKKEILQYRDNAKKGKVNAHRTV